MIAKFGCISLIVGIVALLCGRRQIHQRDTSEFQGWLTENGYQQVAHVFQVEGIVKLIFIPQASGHFIIIVLCLDWLMKFENERVLWPLLRLFCCCCSGGGCGVGEGRADARKRREETKEMEKLWESTQRLKSGERICYSLEQGPSNLFRETALLPDCFRDKCFCLGLVTLCLVKGQRLGVGVSLGMDFLSLVVW